MTKDKSPVRPAFMAAKLIKLIYSIGIATISGATLIEFYLPIYNRSYHKWKRMQALPKVLVSSTSFCLMSGIILVLTKL